MSTWIYSLSLHDALPIWNASWLMCTSLISTVARGCQVRYINAVLLELEKRIQRSEEHTSELQSRGHLVCRLLLEKKNTSERVSIMWTSFATIILHYRTT